MFAKEQPDLNWENPVVRQKIYEMVNWWLDKGVAGFRIDAIINIKKDINFPSFEPDGPDGLVTCIRMVEEVNGVGDFLEELKHETFEKYDAFTVGEVFNMKEDELLEFIGEDGHFSTMFDFSAHVLTFGEHGWYDQKPLRFEEWRKVIFDSQQELQGKCFKANIIENHDEPRGVSYYIPEGECSDQSKKMLATLYFMLRGLPFIYQGQEIGMENLGVIPFEKVDDVSALDQYHVATEAGYSEEEALKIISLYNRDNARTPVQWNAGTNAGFTTGTPWIKVNDNYKTINAKSQVDDPDSIFNCYRKLVSFRKEYPVLVDGSFKLLLAEDENIFAYERKNADETLLVVCNFYGNTVKMPLTEETEDMELLISNYKETEDSSVLRPYEARMYYKK